MRIAAVLVLVLVAATQAAGAGGTGDTALDGLITYASYRYVPDNVKDDGSALCGVGLDARAVDLVPYEAGGLLVAAAWSPDGSGLAFGEQSNLAPLPITVVLRPLDTEAPQNGPWGTQPSWSPDGTRVALTGVGTRDEFGGPAA